MAEIDKENQYDSVQDYLVKELGYEIKDEYFLKGGHKIPFTEIGKHTVKTFAEKLRRDAEDK